MVGACGPRHRSVNGPFVYSETISSGAEGSAAANEMGAMILDALSRAPLFIAAALPARVFPPLFNAYAGGEGFGIHVDNAVRLLRGGDGKVRSDLSATLFLSDPDDYEGGELVV